MEVEDLYQLCPWYAFCRSAASPQHPGRSASVEAEVLFASDEPSRRIAELTPSGDVAITASAHRVRRALPYTAGRLQNPRGCPRRTPSFAIRVRPGSVMAIGRSSGSVALTGGVLWVKMWLSIVVPPPDAA